MVGFVELLIPTELTGTSSGNAVRGKNGNNSNSSNSQSHNFSESTALSNKLAKLEATSG